MAWRHYLTEIESKVAMVLLDDRFETCLPVDQLPQLAWFGLFARQDPGSHFWHPEESSALDRIEDDLMRLSQELGRGWAVYVRRLDTRGIREYYLYTSGTVQLAEVLPRLRTLHPDYRIEFDVTADAQWSQYTAWLNEPHTQVPEASGG
jgi:hypothetical protein